MEHYKHSDNDLDIMARTLFGEARGEYMRPEGGLSALIGVANVIVNRWQLQRFGLSLSAVCTKPYQFSCWNRQDPNRAIIEKVQASDPIFSVCRDVARQVAVGQWPDLTHGADHYHATSMKQLPNWAVGLHPCARLGNHVFYRLITH